MAQAYQCRTVAAGDEFDYTPVAAVAAGQVVIQNGMFAFANVPIAAAAKGALATAGGRIVALVKENGAMSVGNAIYWAAAGNPQGGTAGTGAATTTATGNTYAGRCVAAAGANDEFVLVQLDTGVVTQGGLENAITDPGNAGAIPVTRTGRVALVSAGAETRTIAAPSFAGQELLLYMKTDGGDITVTVATTVNEAGNNTIVFDNTGEACRLVAVEEGANLRWRLAAVDGAALSTV